MFAQLKYSAKIYLDARILTALITVVVSLVFTGLNALNVLPGAWMVTGVVLSSLCATGLFVVCVLADFESIRSLFSAPNGYATLLTPVPAWKILLSRVLTMTVLDILSLSLGAFGIILQAGVLTSDMMPHGLSRSFSASAVTTLINGLLGYIMMFLLVIFACAVTKGLFFPFRARGFLGFLATCVVMYLAGFLNLLLAPFAEVTRFKAFFSVSLVSGWNPGMIAFIVLTLLEAAALLFAASYLYERKVNL